MIFLICWVLLACVMTYIPYKVDTIRGYIVKTVDVGPVFGYLFFGIGYFILILLCIIEICKYLFKIPGIVVKLYRRIFIGQER